MGEVPAPPTTGFAPLLVALQPAMLRTVMLMSPRLVPPQVPSWTQFINACINPITVTGLVVVEKQFKPAHVSMMGMVTMELLVATKLPLCGLPVPAWI